MFLSERYIRIATKGSILGSLLNHGFCNDLVIVSDDAGQFDVLNQLVKRIHGNKEKLLKVLELPAILLYTNGSETDIREYVKKRKVSAGTRSDVGQRSRDTFISLKKTCRKLGIPFWDLLQDRIS